MKSFSLLCLIPFATAAPGYFYNTLNSPTYAFTSYPTQVAAYPRALAYQAPNLNPRNNLKTGDIIADTRALSNQVQTTLRQLASDPASAAIINRIINDKDNICLSNLEEGIAGIEAATK